MVSRCILVIFFLFVANHEVTSVRRKAIDSDETARSEDDGASSESASNSSKDIIKLDEDESDGGQEEIDPDESGSNSSFVSLNRSEVASATLEVETHLGQLHESRYRAYRAEESCSENAANAFEHVDIPDLSKSEKVFFEQRFIEKLVKACQTKGKKFASNSKHWTAEVMKQLEEEKPPLTKKRADMINAEQGDFEVQIQPWMEQESMAMFKAMLVGDDSDPKAMHKEATMHEFKDAPEDTRSDLPLAFEGVEKWPKCEAAFRRSIMQGGCASCWAMAAIATVDTRLCIETGGATAQQPRSRATGSNCAAESLGRANACKGGSPFAPWDYLESGKGIPSEQCVPYYGTGVGIDVFKSGDSAPKCRSECQVDFKETFAQDAWFIKGMGEGKYQLRQSSKNFEARAKQELFDNGPYVGTMHASRVFLGYKKGVFYKPEWCLKDGCTKAGQCTNHAVTLTGYTPKSWIGLNSWGKSWADPKRPNVFEIGTCMIDYWMIPGKISASKCPPRSDCGGKTCEEWVDMGKTCGEIQKKHSKCDCSVCNWQDGPGNFQPLC